MVFVPHCLAYFTYNKALQFHPCHCKGCKLLLSLSCIEFHCVNIPQFLDPLICWWALRLLPVLGYCELCCYEHWGAQVLLDWCFRVFRVWSQQWNCWVKRRFIFVFWGNSIVFSTVASPVCIPTNSALGFPFLHILSNICLWICLCWPLWLVWDGTSLWF